MARSHSSYTASPMRHRSPRHSPARRPTSEDGSQYELDLDALGMNSTFESTGLEESRDPNVDVVDTSDIEGPDDFTMNMTYWMTADLPLAQIKSRKEASSKVQEVRGDARLGENGGQDTIEEGDEAFIQHSARDRQGEEEDFNSASPTVRVRGSTDDKEDRDDNSDSSMENDEKVMSYLDALPDTDIPDAISSTPMQVQNRNMLQLPKRSPSRTRSLQPTVEDCDTPRKPTQATVIHHVLQESTEVGLSEEDKVQSKIADLHSRLQQQELASKTRITELETLLSFTRSELEARLTANYTQKEKIAYLEGENDRLFNQRQASEASAEKRLKEQGSELKLKRQEFEEELRLQNLAKLQSQREDFEQQLAKSEDAKRAVQRQVEAKDRTLSELRSELGHLKQAKEQELQAIKTTHSAEHQKHEQTFAQERTALNEKLSALQTQADNLQASLAKATAEAKSAREEAQANAVPRLFTPSSSQNDLSRISELESRIETLQSQLHESRTSNATKDQELLRTSDLESRIQSLQSQLDSSRAEVTTSKEQALQRNSDLESRLQSLQAQLDASRANLSAKDQDVLRKTDLESQIQTLQSHLEAARAEATAKEQELKHKSDLESRIQSLQSQTSSSRTDLAAKDQCLLRNIEEKERLEERLNTAQGRIEGLETTITTLRQQVAEAQRQSSKSRTDVERYERELEDATDRLEDARAEADRRVADMEKKLSKMKDSKMEVETRLKHLASSHENLIEEQEMQLDDVRSNAEDAVRKAGAIVEQERSEKRKLIKELKAKTIELENLRAESARKMADTENVSDDDDDEEEEENEPSSSSASARNKAEAKAKDVEIANLRTLIRTQAATMKTLKSDLSALRKTHTRTLSKSSTQTELDTTIQTLHAELHVLRKEKATLTMEAAAREEDLEATNKAMDEKLAAMMSKVLKERARTVVGMRDGQWAETLGKKQDEREFMGKLLMREWGRQEVGVADEREGLGEKQRFRYKYVKRT
ncbi:hypothetical protein K504DRAFT_463470 [Pleomassaria siparia CBS 279.74]|uniref:Uncharacterized protein n=1 Tax=Pleomassaria siparia CBS 279.74 TaxID=1314801 RepID=A0A6G1JTB1_9PLEO|nr:hypothetical protein K504DRAFT_463470 [Pleomassaria siparia CBS 279.74]